MVGATSGRLVYPARHRWPVRLAYGGIILDPFRRRDLDEWLAVRRRNQAWLRPWDATAPVPGARPGPHHMMTRLRREARDGRTVPWVVRAAQSPGSSPLIGQCTLSNVMLGSARFASIGYWIDQRYAGRGLTPLAVALATDYAMTTMRLHRVEICIRPENTASLRVVEKLGFRYEGIRPRFLHIAGDWRDHKCFALDATEVGEGLVPRLMGASR